MQAHIKKFAPLAFLAASCGYVLADVFGWHWAQLLLKPLLMPVLMAYVFASTPASKGRTLILVALFFSFTGDVLLMLEYNNPLLFIPGLICFLITHILYIVYFSSLGRVANALFKSAPLIAAAVTAYGFFLLYILFPHLGALKVPVTVYAVVIMSMLLCAIHIYRLVGAETGKYFVAGALFFVLSDSLLAINKFSTPLHFPYLIMITYCLAQFLIVQGCIRHCLMLPESKPLRK